MMIIMFFLLITAFVGCSEFEEQYAFSGEEKASTVQNDEINQNTNRVASDNKNIYYACNNTIIKSDLQCKQKSVIVEDALSSAYMYQLRIKDNGLFCINRGEGIYRLDLESENFQLLYGADVTDYTIYNDEIYFIENLTTADKKELRLCSINLDGQNVDEVVSFTHAGEGDKYKLGCGILGIHNSELFIYDIVAMGMEDAEIKYYKMNSHKEIVEIDENNYFTELDDKLNSIHQNAVLYNGEAYYVDSTYLETHESILYGYDLASDQITFSAHTKGNDVYVLNDKLYILDADDNIEVIEFE
jgi:hypothetical protein